MAAHNKYAVKLDDDSPSAAKTTSAKAFFAYDCTAKQPFNLTIKDGVLHVKPVSLHPMPFDEVNVDFDGSAKCAITFGHNSKTVKQVIHVKSGEDLLNPAFAKFDQGLEPLLQWIQQSCPSVKITETITAYDHELLFDRPVVLIKKNDIHPLFSLHVNNHVVKKVEVSMTGGERAGQEDCLINFWSDTDKLIAKLQVYVLTYQVKSTSPKEKALGPFVHQPGLLLLQDWIMSRWTGIITTTIIKSSAEIPASTHGKGKSTDTIIRPSSGGNPTSMPSKDHSSDGEPASDLTFRAYNRDEYGSHKWFKLTIVDGKLFLNLENAAYKDIGAIQRVKVAGSGSQQAILFMPTEPSKARLFILNVSEAPIQKEYGAAKCPGLVQLLGWLKTYWTHGEIERVGHGQKRGGLGFPEEWEQFIVKN